MSTKYGIWFVVMWSCLCLVGNAWAGDKNNDGEKEDAAEQLKDLREELAEVSRMPRDDPATRKLKERIFSEVIRRAVIADQARFHISGSVVDSTGKPLENVTVRYLVSRPISATDVDYFGEGEQAVDGEFDVITEAGVHAMIRFEKDDYYPEERSFAVDESDAQAGLDILAGWIPKRDKTEIKDLEIVMQKMGDVTQLQRRNVTLSYFSDGSGQIFDFGRALDHARIGKEVGVEDVTDAEQLSEKAVYVIGDMGKDGVIPYEEVPFEDMFSSVRGRCQVPKNLRMVVTDPEGGIQLFQPEGELRGSNRVARHMTRAPEKGYEQVLDLPKGIASRGYRFYFKVGEHYGRGRLRFPKISRDGQTFEIGVEFQIQPDGSRNLETMTWRH